MHYHLEVIMPPTTDIEKALEEILLPFCEDPEPEEKDGDWSARYTFWDWYRIGGRYAGEKLRASLDPVKIEEFYEWLKERGTTVSSVQCGKQTLSPASQKEDIEAKWKEMGFPGDCPIFEGLDRFDLDICKLEDLPERTTAFRVIIAGPSYDPDNPKLRASFMLAKEVFNGCTWQDTTWDGNVKKAIQQYLDISWTREDRKPGPDWLCVTIDYHS